VFIKYTFGCFGCSAKKGYTHNFSSREIQVVVEKDVFLPHLLYLSISLTESIDFYRKVGIYVQYAVAWAVVVVVD
jgi:hypothetical protein